MTTRKIQILGTGCARCIKLTNATRAAADQLGLSYELEKVTEIAKIVDFGVMATPALVVDGKVLVAGRVPGAEELRALLQEAPKG